MVSIPSHVRFFHILFLPALALQMKSLTSNGLTPSRTWVLHSCRTSVVWLRGWMADRRPVVKSEMPCFGEKPERTCHVSFTGLETRRKSKIRERERRETSNLSGSSLHVRCPVWKHSRMIAFWSQQSVCLCHLLFPPPCPSCPVLCVYVRMHRSVGEFSGMDLPMIAQGRERHRSPMCTETSAYTSGFGIIIIRTLYTIIL